MHVKSCLIPYPNLKIINIVYIFFRSFKVLLFLFKTFKYLGLFFIWIPNCSNTVNKKSIILSVIVMPLLSHTSIHVWICFRHFFLSFVCELIFVSALYYFSNSSIKYVLISSFLIFLLNFFILCYFYSYIWILG